MVSVRIEGAFVVLNDGQMWDYDIPLRDLMTPDGLQRWVDHLSEKNWVTKPMLDEVRRIATGHSHA